MTPIEIYAMLQRKINEGGYGSPLVASAAENMTDQNRVYVYTGSETGMETGHWYYYDGEDWADGGVYNAVAVQTDKTLTQENKAADGKATGDELAQLKSDLTTLAPKEDMLKSFPTDTASGSVASFADGANVPVKSLIVNIDPVQSGSGDPSPSNVRPISGWSEVNVSHSGADMTNPTVISIQLGQTVYGGTLDVTNGVLTVDREMITLDGSQTVNNNGATTATSRFTYVPSNKSFGRSNIISDRFYYTDTGDNVGRMACRGNSNTVEFYLPASVPQTIADGKAWFAENPTHICYELATPITAQLTPHEVTALLGSNNIWADSGDTAVEYRADPKLYIQRLTEPDADMVADANIVSGQYFMVGNTLYKATANIASGGAITPNVNCTRKSLSEALNELNV